MSTITISDRVKTKLEDIARHLNVSKEEVIETALLFLKMLLRKRNKKR